MNTLLCFFGFGETYRKSLQDIVFRCTCCPHKHYDNMTKQEKIEYKKWLSKNNLWDGAVVFEHLIQSKRLIIGK